MFSSEVDAICVSGPLTGQPVASSDLEKVKAAVPDRPVLANTDVNLDDVAAILEVPDGCVIGTHFKVGGDTTPGRQSTATASSA